MEISKQPREKAEHWDAIYGRTPVEQTGWYEDSPTISLELIEHCSLDPAGTVVDAGAGASRLADELLDRGFQRLVLVDISDVALARTRDRLGDAGGRVTYIAGNLCDPTLLDAVGPVALWHDRAALHFLVDDADRAGYLANLEAAVAPGGYVILATFAPQGAEH